VLSLFGATAGQGVVWYTSQFYSLTFLTTYAKVPTNDAYLIVLVALVLASPAFIVVGHLSDTYGRKPFMLAGITLAVATWYPIFQAFITYGFKNGNYQPALLSFLVWVQVLYVALVYGPIAAFLVELFPTSIRYSSMSLPYHIGNGVFGGLVPVIGVSVTTASGNVYGGLWFPLAVAGFTLIVMFFLTPETFENELHPEYEAVTEKAHV
jgi:MFS family permease